MESKWIKFEKTEDTGKTSVHAVITKDGSKLLGWIKWWPNWRTYSFMPREYTVFETQCLSDIISFINKLMLERKVKRQNQKNSNN